MSDQKARKRSKTAFENLNFRVRELPEEVSYMGKAIGLELELKDDAGSSFIRIRKYAPHNYAMIIKNNPKTKVIVTKIEKVINNGY